MVNQTPLFRCKIFLSAALALALVFAAAACGERVDSLPTDDTTTIPRTTDTAAAVASTPGPLTREQARTLAADLFARARDVELVFDAGLPSDGTALPGREYERIAENSYGIHDIASLKAFAERTHTKGYARQSLYQVEDGMDEAHYCGRYYEENGVLYGFGGGIGGSDFTIRTEAAEIQSQTNDTILLQMEIVSTGSEGDLSAQLTWRLKWEGGGWKMDCGYMGTEPLAWRPATEYQPKLSLLEAARLVGKNNYDFEHPVHQDAHGMEFAADDTPYHLFCGGPEEDGGRWYYSASWKEFVLDEPETGLGHWTSGGSTPLRVDAETGEVFELDWETGEYKPVTYEISQE